MTMNERHHEELRAHQPEQWLIGGGEMERRIRSFDWSGTPLGPLEDWPQSLKTALKIALNSRYPIWMGWGRELVNLYNDPYIPVLGKRDEWALGASARDVWKEVWEEHLGPQAEAVLLRGEASWNDQRQMVMYRNGYAEETYFTFSFSPLPGDEGGIGGLFCACTEDTQKVLGERRLAALRHLASATADARTEIEAGAIAARTLSEHDADVSFALVYLISSDGAEAVLTAGSGEFRHARWAPPHIALSAEQGTTEDAWPLRKAMTEGTQLLRDIHPERALPGGRWPEPATMAAVVPLAKAGHGTPRGFLVVGASPRLPFDQNYESFFELLARGTADALSNARAYEEEKKRAEALAELDRAKTAFFSNVSHEFRTPLTLMLGPLEDLLSHGKTPREAQGELQLIHRNSLRLLKLVNSLLEFSRIEAGRVRATYAPTDLAGFTAELAGVFRSAVEKAGLRLVVDCPPLSQPLYVDRDMWEQIVLNLLSNAFKFTFAGEIGVSVREVASDERRGASETVASGEGRGAIGSKGDGEKQLGGATNERSELSGAKSVGAGDDLSGTVLSRDKGISEGRTVRVDEPDSPRRGIDSGQHRRGTGPAVHEGISELSQYRPRLPNGVGDASAAESTSFAAQGDSAGTAPGDFGRSQPDVVRTPAGVEASPLGTHHSPLTTRFVELRVRDTGIGIAPEEVPRVFDRFHRIVGAQGRTHEGTGIGLAMVQELVKLHGGTVRVDSAPGRGSTFYVRIPTGSAHLPQDHVVTAAPREAAPALGATAFVEEALRWLPDEGSSGWRVASGEKGPEEEERIVDHSVLGNRHAAHASPSDSLATRHSALATRPRVLLADDNADMRRYVARLLAERYDVETVADGRAALAAVTRRRPDLILSDVMMPRLDGFGLLHAVRADPATKTIPVILVSARAGEESRVEGFEQGADDYLIKPFSARELLARVEAHLRMAQLRREADEALRRRSVEFETLLNQAPLGVYLVDADFRIAQVNPTALPVFGDIPDLIGRDFAEVIHILWPEAYADEVVALFRHTLETGEPYVVPEWIEQRRDRGLRECYEWRIDRILLPEGRYGVVCYFREISAQVEAREAIAQSEERLRAFAGQLEQLVAERTQELLHSQERLRALATELNLTEQRERKRLAIELHDHLAQLLVLGRLKLSQAKRVPGLVPACAGLIAQAEAVLDESLTYTRTLVADLSPPVLHDLGLTAALKWLGQRMRRHDLAVTVEAPEEERDRLPEEQAVLLFQSVRELLMNAVKHAKSAQAVVSLERRDGELRIHVRDDGEGFDPAVASLSAATATSSKFGLFSIRERMRALGGAFHVESAVGKGTTATLALPLSGGAAASETRVTSETGGTGRGSALESGLMPVAPLSLVSQVPQHARIRVLLVDDHAMVRQGLRSVLESYPDLEVVGEAANGEEAVASAARLEPTVVVMDINMPKMNGIEATARIKARFPGIVIIGLSVNATGENQEAMTAAGAAALLTKEAAVDELYEAIRSTLRERTGCGHR